MMMMRIAARTRLTGDERPIDEASTLRAGLFALPVERYPALQRLRLIPASRGPVSAMGFCSHYGARRSAFLSAVHAESDLKRIGILYQDPLFVSRMVTFRQTFRELGYVEGKTIAYEYRLSSEQELDRSAQELVHSGVNLVIAPGTPPALALKRATAEVPIVFIAVDPVASGLVASFGHPGAKATGVATLSEETGAKRIELLKELLPRAKRIGVLVNQSNSMNAVQLTSIESAAARLKLNSDELIGGCV